MSIVEVKVIAAIRRWCYDRHKLASGKGNQYKHRGFQRRDERTFDARIVRVLDFERAFTKMPAGAQVLILLVHRDGLTPEEAASIIGVSVPTIRKCLMDTRQALAVLLEQVNAL